MIQAGYPEGETQLGIQTVICAQNIKEIPELWIWARSAALSRTSR